MESKRNYISESTAYDYMQAHNIEEIPSFSHCISSVNCIKEERATGISTHNIGVDKNGIYLSTNESYLK